MINKSSFKLSIIIPCYNNKNIIKIFFENFFLKKIFEKIKKINDIKYIIENL